MTRNRLAAVIVLVLTTATTGAVAAEPPPAATPAAGSAPAAATGTPSADPPGAPLGAKTPEAPRPDPSWIRPGMDMQIDGYAFAGPGVAAYQRSDGSGLNTNIQIVRARPELRGRLLDRIIFRLQAEAGRTQNVAGEAGRAQGDAQQNPAITASLDNVWAAYEVTDAFQLRVGQMIVPFTREGTTGRRFQSFLEKPLAVRAIGAPPGGKDIGLLAAYDNERMFLGVGYYNGEGRNRAAVDGRGLASARAAYKIPIGPGSQLGVGVSGRYLSRDARSAWFVAQNMTTPGNYAFWQSAYLNNTTETLVISSGSEVGAAGELALELPNIDLIGELVWVEEGRREAARNLPEQTLRTGTLSGIGYYAQAGLWLGNSSWIRDLRGRYDRVGKSAAGPPPIDSTAIEIAARFEQIHAKYDSTARSRGVRGVAPGLLDLEALAIRVDSLALVASVFWTRYVRVSLGWNLFHFPGGQTGEGLPAENQASAPGAVARGLKNTRSPLVPPDTVVSTPFFPPPAPGARVFHEISARIQLVF